MIVVSLDMAYRSFRGGSGRLRHPPRYAAFNQSSSPIFQLSSRAEWCVALARQISDRPAADELRIDAAAYLVRAERINLKRCMRNLR